MVGCRLREASTLFKGTGALKFKAVLNLRRSFRYMRQVGKLEEQKIPQFIREHHVTKALKLSDQAVKRLAKLTTELNNSGFDIELIAQKVLQDFKGFSERVAHAFGLIGRQKSKLSAEQKAELKQAGQELAKAEISALQSMDKEQRKNYTFVLNLVHEEGENHETFMERVRTLFKTKRMNQLMKWAELRDIRSFAKDVGILERDQNDIDKLLKKVNQAVQGKNIREQFPIAIKHLREAVQTLQHHGQQVALHAYEAFQRTLLMTAIALYYMDGLIHMLKQGEAVQFLPVIPAEVDIQKLEAEKKQMGEQTRVLAQGLRILVHEEEGEIKKAQAIEYAAAA